MAQSALAGHWRSRLSVVWFPVWDLHGSEDDGRCSGEPCCEGHDTTMTPKTNLYHEILYVQYNEDVYLGLQSTYRMIDNSSHSTDLTVSRV